MSNLRVLITGGGRGLGLALAQSFRARGASLWLVDLDGEALEAARQKLSGSLNESDSIRCSLVNIDSAEQRKELFEQVQAHWQGLDVLVNNAGVFFGGPFETVALDQHLKTIDVNLKAHIAMTHLFWNLILNSQNQNRGVMSISSSQAFVGVPLASSYAASKWGLLGFMESLRQECRRNKVAVKVLTVCPSTLDTRLFKGTIAPVLMPVLEAQKLSQKILRSYFGGRAKLLEPLFVKSVPFLVGALPQCLSDFLIRLLRVDRALVKWDLKSIDRRQN